MTINRLCLYNDAEEAMRQVLDGRQSMIWTTMPGIVTSVNLSQMTVEVQPAIQGVTTDENGVQTFVNLPKLVDVPIVFMSAGGFTITLPIAVNDECFVSWGSRCIDAWWQNGAVVNGVPSPRPPMEARMHDMSDGFAFFSPKSQPNVIDNISDTDLQIRNDEGTGIIGMKPNGAIYLTPASGQVVTVNGSLVATGEVTAGSIELTQHIHPQSSGGNTGMPTG